MKTKYLVRWKERETLEILDKVLQRTPYRVFSKVRLSDVLGKERGENLSSDDYNFLLTAHFDFVVYERRGYMSPVFAVEFDGPHHQEATQVKRDIKKNRLCMRAKLPLLRIGYAELEEHDQVTLLEFMLQRFVAWQREHGQIVTEIGSYMAGLEPEEVDRLTEGGLLDPSIDPSFIFDINHIFPGIPKVARRLLGRFGILTPYLPMNLVAKLNLGNCPFRCEIMPGKANYSSGWNVLKESCYTLYRHNPSIKSLHWAGGKLQTPGIEVLSEGSAEFAMQWAIPVVEGYDPGGESGFEYFARKGELPYTLTDAPGVNVPSIVEWFSEYLALREVEKWAEVHLSPSQRKS